MRVVIGADHGGYALKDELKGFVESLGHEVIDAGAHELDPADDFPGLHQGRGRVRGLKRSPAGNHDLRQRGRRVSRGQQGQRNPRERVSRHLFGPPGRRARRHERAVPRSADSRNRGCQGARDGVPIPPSSPPRTGSSDVSTRCSIWSPTLVRAFCRRLWKGMYVLGRSGCPFV